MSENATILIVDDNLENLHLLFDGLRQAGYEVMVAQDGASALKRVAMRTPDLILLDVIMPGMDGFAVATQLKAQPQSRHIPIIFLTAVNETASIVKGFTVGGVDYLVKPLRMEEALARIHTQVSLHSLQRHLEARTHELAALLELSRTLASTLDRARLPDLIFDQIKTVAAYTSCTLLTLSDDQVCFWGYRGPPLPDEILHEQVSPELLHPQHGLFVVETPRVVTDLQADAPVQHLLQQYGGGWGQVLLQDTRAWMGIPLVVRQELIGGLSLSHEQPGRYTRHHAELAVAFAHHAAVAIENARLYQQAKQVAIHEERNRLAQNLHDSVTQSLFSANLIAEVLPQLWQTSPEEARHGLAELQRLTHGALMEMRSLLLELRPATLLQTHLDDLLRQLGHALVSQTLVNITLDLTPTPALNLPPEVHVTFYRVAQEALNNIVKHAQAKNITVNLHPVAPDGLTLDIWDDGHGFENDQTLSGKFGLEIMRERAKQIQARLTISSQPGSGTRVVLTWPDADSLPDQSSGEHAYGGNAERSGQERAYGDAPHSYHYR